MLVHLLIGSDLCAVDSATIISEIQAWPEIVECAEAWRVTPGLAAQIARLNLKVPEAAAFDLRRNLVAAYSNSAFIASKGIAAIRWLEARGIRVAAFKGLASMAQLHNGPKGRFINDVDLLVREADLERAVSCLEQNGFRRAMDGQLNEYAALVAHLPASAGNQAITMRAPGGGEIDLHWAVGKGLYVPAILGRRGVARLWDHEFPVVSMEDGTLLTVRHAIREDLKIEDMCRDLIDTKLRIADLVGKGSFRSLAERAGAAGLAPALLAIIGIITDYDPHPDIQGYIREMTSARERRLSAELVELFRVQLRGGPLGKDLVYLVHQAPIRHIISGLMKDARGYRRLVREFEIHLRGRPRPWLRRLLALTGAVCKLRRRHFRSIRALAEVKYD